MVLWQLKKEMDGNLSAKIKLKDMTGSVCLITGSNSGIGMGVAEQLLALNCHVVMACRSKEKCDIAASKLKEQDLILSKKAGNAKKLSKPKVYYNGTGLITTMTLDLADLDSVKEFTNQFKRKFQRLDVLVNNAGLVANKGYDYLIIFIFFITIIIFILLEKEQYKD
jgi:NAD(P)-dependent dehydrogenase (short-subunit alcohol dehydrogenase family)